MSKPKPKQVISRRSFMRGAAWGLASSISTGAYADYDVHNTVLEKVEVKLDRWKADGLRVGFISDIHVNDPDEMERAKHAAQMLVATSPDILLFGGDCVNSKLDVGLENIDACFEPFGKLKCPKLAVLGNHDYASRIPDKIASRLSQCGFLVLRNETIRFDGYRVAGYDDQIWGETDPNFQPREDGTIILLHEPDYVDSVPETASIQLSGHSHGGQICLPFGVPLHTPLGARKYRRGLYRHAKIPLYVNRGVGTSGFKWRLFCPPEVTLLTLRSAS